MRSSKKIGLLSGFLVFFILISVPVPDGLSPDAMKAAAVTLLMAIWWITEAIPIYMTAFAPLIFFPMLGILTASQTAENYGHNYVLMLLAGFFIAKAIEAQNLHKRIALIIIRKLGTSRKRIIVGFMIATALLSMWIANVAVTLLMLPIALAVVSKEEHTKNPSKTFGTALMLAIAYAASVGGTATLIGTPVNLVFSGIVEKMFPEAPEISFFTWLTVGLPIVIIFIPVIWIYITKYFKVSGEFSGGKSVIEKEYQSLGKISTSEKRVLFVFVLTALGWIFRRDLAFDNFIIPGWGSLLGVADYVHDSTVAMFSAALLFMIPSKKSKPLLTWKQASSVPWGVVMIVGGGYAIAESFKATGLAIWIGEHLSFISTLPLLLVLLVIVGLMIFITEINSNTATANIFLPVLATMAIAGNTNPLLLMIPATFACSFAFMLPSGTGTNTVIFASNRISIKQMAKCGLWLNLISVILVTLLMYLIAIPVLEIDPSILPSWVQ